MTMTMTIKRPNLICGLAIIPWAPITTPYRQDELPAGYVLPGGLREPEYWRAMEVAQLMDKILRGEVPHG